MSMKAPVHFVAMWMLGIALAGTALAQSPREQLRQMAEQLQQNPDDNALRERIIKLALTLKPSPALPTDAERRMARGAAAFKSASSVADYKDAVKEFEQATLASPWYGDAYFNLGLAQDKAGDLDGALRSLKNAGMALPGNKDVTTLIYQVEYRKEKENSPEARAIREKQEEQRFLASLEGARYDCGGWKTDEDAWKRDIEISGGKIVATQLLTWINPRLTPGVNYARNAFVGFKGMWLVPNSIALQGRTSVGRDGPWEARIEIQDGRLVWEIKNGGNKSSDGECRRR
jgi:tetratricopeptide (TPR) repeat protein